LDRAPCKGGKGRNRPVFPKPGWRSVLGHDLFLGRRRDATSDAAISQEKQVDEESRRSDYTAGSERNVVTACGTSGANMKY